MQLIVLSLPTLVSTRTAEKRGNTAPGNLFLFRETELTLESAVVRYMEAGFLHCCHFYFQNGYYGFM